MHRVLRASPAGRLKRAAWKTLIRIHPVVYRATGGRLLPSPLGRSRSLLLDQVGRRSGVRRTTPLLYLADGDDLVVVGSRGGSRTHPDWFLNLRAMDQTEVQVGSERRRVRVRVASPSERERLWPKVVAIWPDYERYQRRTEREIPLVVLSPA